VLKTKWDDFKNGRLYYVMGKNNKPVSIEIPERAKKILAYYEPFKEENQGFVFPALKEADLSDPIDIEIKLQTAINVYGRYVQEIANKAKISKSVSPHIARHTFGNLAGDQISPQLLQAIYRHSDIKTTMNYQQHWMNKDKLDGAIQKVVNF
jgi:integrase